MQAARTNAWVAACTQLKAGALQLLWARHLHDCVNLGLATVDLASSSHPTLRYAAVSWQHFATHRRPWNYDSRMLCAGKQSPLCKYGPTMCLLVLTVILGCYLQVFLGVVNSLAGFLGSCNTLLLSQVWYREDGLHIGVPQTGSAHALYFW